MAVALDFQYRNSVDDTLALLVAMLTDGTPEDLRGCPSLGSVALVGRSKL